MRDQTTVHGAFSDLRTHQQYEFSETSSGNTIIRRCFFSCYDWATVKGVGVYQTMNEVDVTKLFYSTK